MRRYLSSAVLLVWGATFCALFFTGRMASTLQPTFKACALLAGVVLILMAIGRLLVGKKVEAAECGHGMFDGGWARQITCTVILLAPLLIAATYAPKGFDANAVLNRGLVSSAQSLPSYQPPAAASGSADSNPYVPKAADGNIKAETVDLVYAAEEPSMQADFENKEVELVGQYMPATSNNPKGDRFNLVRMFMSCCAADARPVAVAVQTPGGDKITEMSWIKVTGKATFPVEGGRRQPVVVAESVKPCDPPDNTFIY